MKHLALFLAFGTVLACWQAVAQDTQPRVSATDSFYLSCTVWTGKEWTPPTARSTRTPVAESKKGYRSYAEVNVFVRGESCENSSKLYVARGAKQPFTVAYAEPRSGSGGGNGIRLIGWSENGDKLLAEVNFWKYETDRGFWHVPLIYDALTGTAAEVRGVDKALTRHFGRDCEFEPSVKGWKGKDQILVEVSRPPEDESYEQDFCVTSHLILVYDLQKKTVQPEIK